MEKEYIYYWYHHMMPDSERAKIANIFREKIILNLLNTINH